MPDQQCFLYIAGLLVKLLAPYVGQNKLMISILGRLLVPCPQIEYSSLVARTRIINQCKGRQFVSHPDEVQTNFPTPAAAFHYSNTAAPKFCTPYFVLLISYRPVRDLNSFMGFFARFGTRIQWFPCHAQILFSDRAKISKVSHA